MSYFDADAQEMLDVYILETRQLMDQMDEILLETERKGRMPKEDIDSIFRIMHTAKSSAAMMGLNELSSMAHRLEDIFSVLRDNPHLAEKTQESTVEIMLASSDFIKGELEDMCRDSYHPGDNSHLEAMIAEFAGRVRAFEDIQQEQEADGLGEFMGKPGLCVKVIFEENCKMENIRAYMLLTQAKGICACSCFPPDPEKDTHLAEYIRKHGFLVNFPSENAKEMLPLLRRGLFVKDCEIAGSHLQAPQKEEPPPSNESNGTKARTEFLNVKVERLDKLQNFTGELMILSSSLSNALADCGENELLDKYEYQLQRLLEELENTVIHMRMVPVARMIPKMKRILRDISRKEKKEVEFEAYGQEMEADKNIVDQLSEAAMHIIRNAVDHGIESPDERRAAGKPEKGKIVLSAEGRDGELLVTVSDDGRGMDTDKILRQAKEKGLLTKPEEEYDLQELFEISTKPGFSTKEKATEYSGRGVGLDVVKKIAEDAGGHLRIESEKGKGSSVILHLPLTMTIMESTLFTVGDSLFSLPSRQVCRFFEWGEKENTLCVKDGKNVFMFEELLLPVIDLAKQYGIKKQKASEILIYVKGPTKEACIQADRIVGQSKIVLKPLPQMLGKGFRHRTGMSACSITGNGRICMALDAESVIKTALREESHD